MAVLITGNYFVVSRRAAVAWLLIYITAHVAMVFSGLWIGVEPPLSSVSLAQGITALVDNSLVLMALGPVIIFYHHSDVQSHLMLERRREDLGRDTAKLKSVLSARAFYRPLATESHLHFRQSNSGVKTLWCAMRRRPMP